MKDSISYARNLLFRFNVLTRKSLPLSIVLLLLFAVGCGAGPHAGIPTATMSADKTSLVAGGSATLTWTTTGATTVSIDNGVGSVGATGSTQVTPTATTTYTLTATSSAGTSTATATITVIPVATVTISANPATVKRGQSSVLTITATNAQSVVVSMTG